MQNFDITIALITSLGLLLYLGYALLFPEHN